ncbi:allantoinase AllB [uncultured Corynebacterium sp.]|uniref:allantoinase AllB n=1 Tax=uncultured Corynebacterium sp. TaxID=159447 RepID=UPI0025F043C2|nr:allantoinase AllB [uncultured Corynebacterium sp.]
MTRSPHPTGENAAHVGGPITIIRADRAVLPAGTKAATIVVADGVIVDVLAGATATVDAVVERVRARDASGEAGGDSGSESGGEPDADRSPEPRPVEEVRIADGATLLPGLVDSHVHVNEPGRTEWEGFATATRAAAAGGVTTIVDMPLNSVPSTTTMAALAAKRDAAAGQLGVDTGLWGGIVPDNIGTGELVQMWDAGVFGFKCFLIHSGVDDFPEITYDQLRTAMAEVASFGGRVIAHCEDPWLVAEASAAVRRDAAPGTVVAGGGRDYASYLATRPPESERAAVRAFIDAAEATRCRAHIVHVTEADSVDLIRAAQARGVPVTAETCPHYLVLTAEAIADGATHQKCAPPIREARHREALWRGLADGTLCAVVTDHSPCPPDLKLIDDPFATFGEAWGGIASLELSLALTWTAARIRGFSLDDVIAWMARGPADLTGMKSKGRIAKGAHADFVEFDPDATFLVRGSAMHQRHPVTAYPDHPLAGVVRRTWVRGAVAYEVDGAASPFPPVPAGSPITRKDVA